jgi:hypothetical protein
MTDTKRRRPADDDTVRAEIAQVRDKVARSLGAEELLVGAFLSQMGPAHPPAGLVERTCQLIAGATKQESRRLAAIKQVQRAAGGMSWALRGPVLALNGEWASHGARQTVRGLSTVRYALGYLPLPAWQRAKPNRLRWAARLLLRGTSR